MELEETLWRSHLEEAGHSLIAEGAELLLEERFEEALIALDGALELAPSLRPCAWQRGFALYYAGRYAEAAVQFELNSEVDPDDMEPVFWKFLCDTRVRDVEHARASLPQHSSDPRPVMMELLDLYQTGHGRTDQVIAATATDEHMLTMAHFYCGLYLEALGKPHEARTLLETAVHRVGWEGFVGKLMGVHLRVLKQRLHSDAVPLTTVRHFSTPVIIKGGWQLSDGHHEDGTLARDQAVQDMRAHVKAGITAMDCGDIYTGVEELIGRFLRTYTRCHQFPRHVQVHTKFVPDLDQLSTLDATYVRQCVQRSLNRLGVETVDLIQFHWWDYSVRRYVEVAKWLCALKQEGMVKHIGITNFDLARTRELVEAGVDVACTQVQLSMLDQRPKTSDLLDYAQSQGIAVLAYGVLAGGFLTDAWLGKPEPTEKLMSNRSLIKYRLIIQEWGPWALFQELLHVLRGIADSLGVAIAEVVVRWTLDQDGVSACIIGSRNVRHLPGTVEAATTLRLRPEHYKAIEAVLSKAKGVSGEVYGLEREGGQQRSILRCNLQRLGGGEHLEEVVSRFLDGLFYRMPHEATKAGYHKYDDRLPSFSSRGLASWLGFCDSLLKEIGGIRRDLLSREQTVDLELVTSALQLAVLEGEEGFRIDHAVTSTFEALSVLADERDMGQDAPKAQQREDLLEARLRGLITEIFAWGPWEGESGRRALLALGSYIRDLGGVRGPRLASVCAATAMATRVVAARAERGGKGKGTVGVGRDRLRRYVRWRHHMPTETGEGRDVLDVLLQRAEERFVQVEGMLRETARQIDGSGDREWKDVAKELRKDHPAAKDLMCTYLEAMDRALKHVLDCGSVALPSGVCPSVEGYETPEAQRPFSPFGDFHNPAPFSTDRTGYLMLHPLEEGDEGLGDHDIHWIEIIAMHEFFPGHYQQSLLAQTHVRPLRRWFVAPTLYEGWGLYVEQLGLETGFYSDPLRARLTQLRLQLWRTARVILDIKLNSGEMSVEQCCQFLQDNVLFSPQAARGEVMLYVTMPGYALSYLCGFDQIMSLREERRRALDQDFDLTSFHRDLLKHGTIPVPLIRYLNEEEWRAQSPPPPDKA